MTSDIRKNSGPILTDVLRNVNTAEKILIPIPQDAFNEMYSSLKLPNSGKPRRNFGDPAPIGLMGFLLSAAPRAASLLGLRGAGGNGGAILPVYIFFGGLMLLLAGVGEWILGDTFYSVAFFTYGAFWVVEGTTLMPFFAVGVNYSPTGDNFQGEATSSFYATTGFFYVFITIISVAYLVCALRVNITLVIGLVILILDFSLIAGINFQAALGNLDIAARLQTGAGVLTWLLCIPIGLVFIAHLMEAVDFPYTIPLGDLSMVVVGKNQKARLRRSGQVESGTSDWVATEQVEGKV